GFKVFPNPTHSIIHLEAQLRDNIGDLHVEVFGDTGQVVYRSTFPHAAGLWQHQLDLKKLRLIPGQYIVRLSNGISAEERKVVFTQ
ncbi:MAG: T9SS type A sorting domain-containing protein, partial [Saprospiraceae bacterium]